MAGHVNRSDQPNIALIIVHDLGTHLGCYGQVSVRSRALDRLAGEGVLFENHFCTAPYCSPSRGAMFTGKHPHTNGLMGLVNLDWDLPADNVTLSQVLGRAGYETYLFGLQHEVREPERLHDYYDHVSDRSRPRYCEDVASEVAEFFGRWDHRGDQPFYASVGFFEVHRPYDRYQADPVPDVVVPPYLQDTPGAREDFAMFHGSIRAMDKAVEQVLDALERSGLAEDTVVIFATDHGIDFPRAKGTLYDPGLRTSLLIRWPGRLAAGKRVSDLMSSVDLLPSLLEAVGIAAPPGLLGRSFWSLLVGGSYQPNEHIFAEMNTVIGDAKRCIRTAHHKYIRNHDSGPSLCMGTCTEISLTRRDMGDAHLAPRPAIELYDLEQDPLEFENLAGHPEHQQIEVELASDLASFLGQTADPILRGPVPRPPGEAPIYRRIWTELPGDSHHPMRDIDQYLRDLAGMRRL